MGFTITWQVSGRLQTIKVASAWEAVTELTRRGAWNTTGLKIKAPEVGTSLDELADLAAGQGDDSQLRAKKSAAGRLGGLKGGKARTAAMTPEQRRAAAERAARARWERPRTAPLGARERPRPPGRSDSQPRAKSLPRVEKSD